MARHEPPKLPLKLFRFYCSEDRLEELEGDLFEIYQESEHRCHQLLNKDDNH